MKFEVQIHICVINEIKNEKELINDLLDRLKNLSIEK